MIHWIFKYASDKYTIQREKNFELLEKRGFEGKMRLVMELRSDFLDETKRHLCIVKGIYLG